MAEDNDKKLVALIVTSGYQIIMIGYANVTSLWGLQTIHITSCLNVTRYTGHMQSLVFEPTNCTTSPVKDYHCILTNAVVPHVIMLDEEKWLDRLRESFPEAGK